MADDYQKLIKRYTNILPAVLGTDDISTPSIAPTFTAADIDMLVDAFQKKEMPILKKYRDNCLCFPPPFIDKSHDLYGSKLYLKSYSIMREQDMEVSDDFRRKLWMLIYLYDKDPSILGKTIEEVNKQISNLEREWIKECGRKENLNWFINENHTF